MCLDHFGGRSWMEFSDMCTYVCAHMCMHMWACVWTRGGLGNLLSLSILTFEAWSFIEAEAGWLSKLGWSVSSSQPPVSTPPVLWLQCVPLYLLFTWVLGIQLCRESTLPTNHLLSYLSAVSLYSIIHFLPWTPATQDIGDEHTSFPQDVSQVGMGHSTPNHTCILWDSAAYWHMVHEWSHHQIENWVIGLTWEPGSRWCSHEAPDAKWEQLNTLEGFEGWDRRQSSLKVIGWAKRIVLVINCANGWYPGFHVLWFCKTLKKRWNELLKKKILQCILITKKKRWKPKGENLLFHSNVGGSGKHYSHWNKLNAGKDEKNLWFHSCGI